MAEPTPNQNLTELTKNLSNEELVKVMETVLKELKEVKKDVNAIKTDKVVETLQLPPDVIEATGIVPPPRTLKRGRGSRPLLESEIKEAYEKSDNCSSLAARIIGVNYKTFQKHAKRYGLWRTNPWGKGSRKRYWDPDKGKYPLNQILDGKFPDYPIFRLKDLLIRSGTKKAKCEMCGFEDRRLTDEKMPLLINFEDGNQKNHKLDNLKVYCYNCTFLYGKGYIRRGKTELHFLDPDRMQDSKRKTVSRF